VVTAVTSSLSISRGDSAAAVRKYGLTTKTVKANKQAGVINMLAFVKKGEEYNFFLYEL
jgi:hypothetical protein